MASFGGPRKRERLDGATNGNGTKRSKDMDSAQSALGSKTKPCTKFFSTAGCPFGGGCHFLHYVPGGYNAVAQMTNLGNPAAHGPPSRGPMVPPPMPETHGQSAAPMKTRICNKFNTAEGCKFGDKCRFAHGEREMRNPNHPPFDAPMGPPPMGLGRMPGRMEPPPAAANFGASATAKISVDASLAGAIIGKGGVNTKHICRLTGAKLAIRDHESDANVRNIELEGTFDQINQASAMVRELIMEINASAPMMMKPQAPPPRGALHPPGNNFKTKLCDNFAKGTCTFGDKCHFAHGENELRKSVA